MITVDNTDGEPAVEEPAEVEVDQVVEPLPESAVDDVATETTADEPTSAEPVEPVTVATLIRDLIATVAEVQRHESLLAEIEADRKETKEDLSLAQGRMRRIAGEFMTVGDDNKVEDRIDAPDDAWRRIATADVLVDIEGLGKKKRESILELAPSLGQLEDLRAVAGRAHDTFSSVLPKGVGEQLADKIADRIIDAVAAHYKPETFDDK